MAKFISFFSLSPDALGRLIENPQDGKAPVGKVLEAAGGRLESYYWMFGQYDGVVIAEAPDSTTMAAAVLAIAGSGAMKHLETHELIESTAVVDILRKAKSLRSSYSPTGG